MADSSFDIVSKIDRQEADNALNQAVKEIPTRYDFKNTGADIKWSGEWGVEITANADERALADPRRLQGQAHQARHLAEVARGGRAPPVGQGRQAQLDFGEGITRSRPRRSPS